MDIEDAYNFIFGVSVDCRHYQVATKTTAWLSRSSFYKHNSCIMHRLVSFLCMYKIRYKLPSTSKFLTPSRAAVLESADIGIASPRLIVCCRAGLVVLLSDGPQLRFTRN